MTKGKNKEKVSSKNLKKMLSKVGDKDLSKVVRYLQKKSLVKFNEGNIKLVGKEEVEDYLKEKMHDWLDEEERDLKDKLSEVRKRGKNTIVSNLEIMRLPLKIKLFKATNKKEDLEKVLDLIENIKSQIEEVEGEGKEKD